MIFLSDPATIHVSARLAVPLLPHSGSEAKPVFFAARNSLEFTPPAA